MFVSHDSCVLRRRLARGIEIIMTRSAEHHSETGNRRGQANNLHLMGNLYRYLGQSSSALEYHKKSLDLRLEIGDREGQADSLGSVGQMHEHVEEYDKALTLYKQMLDIHVANQDRKCEGQSLGAIGHVLTYLGEHDSARGHLTQALAISQELQDQEEYAKVLSYLGRLHLRSGEISPGLRGAGHPAATFTPRRWPSKNLWVTRGTLLLPSTTSGRY